MPEPAHKAKTVIAYTLFITVSILLHKDSLTQLLVTHAKKLNVSL